MSIHETDHADISLLLDGLNSAQRDAVCAPPAHVLVLAGAGSGKTRVLIHRIAWLLQMEGVSPFAVLAVTFTNKAANEMRGRLKELLPHCGHLWVGTFHGIAHRLLRQHYHEAKLPESFQILDSEDQLRIVRRLFKEMNLDEKQWPPKQAQWFINKNKEEGIRPTTLVVGNSRFDQHMAEIYRRYQAFCERSGLVDFAELLLRVFELFQQNPPILAHYHARFAHILVDEFQDTNTLQYQWLRLLAGEQAKLFVVGDDDQSIYAWRGARSENLKGFQQDFAQPRLVRLEQNYRSTATILQAANVLIAHNRGRLGKELWTEGEEGEAIGLYSAYNEYDEAEFICARLREWTDNGGGYRECAILYRSNAQSRVIEETLVRAGIPYRVYGGLRFFERAEIKDALAYLRLLANPNDDAAFERIINLPPRGIGPATVELLRAAARREGVSLSHAAQALSSGGDVSGRARNAIQAFLALLADLRADIHAPLHELTETVLAKSGLIAHFKAQKSEKEQMRVENLEELINATRQFESGIDADLTPLTHFLSHTALESGEDQDKTIQDCVQLMTLHSAKGLEFPLVFLCGMEENLFPHQRALNDNGEAGLEEERRLCYVGMTRAMRRLYLSYAQVRRLHGSENYTRPSRFLSEIPPELVEEIRLRQAKPVYIPPSGSSFGSSQFRFKVGQIVTHEKFGKGIVLACEGEGAGERVQVDFGFDGKKWLIVAFAKLEVLSS
jgi:DNA helicase II / ATP-dependent DNA helicase PcrA